MRAAVIIPPFRDFYFTRHRFSSLGARIVADLLERSGLRVNVLNFPLMNILKTGARLELPAELNFLRPFLIENEIGKLSFFTAFRRFGPQPGQCAETIADLRPDICFISLFAFCYADDAIEVAEKIKARLPDIPIVFGGGGAAVYPGYFLKNHAIEYVFSGEAEAGLSRFLTELSSAKPDFRKVPNLAWKRNGSICVSPLHSHVPGTEIELALVKTAEASRFITYSTSLARGCPKSCDFCSSRLQFGNNLRTASLSRLEKLLSDYADTINSTEKQAIINIEDDNLLCDETFLKSSFALFKKYIPDVQFIAENGIDYSLLTPEICEWLLKNGIKKFNLSLASLVPDICVKKKRFFHLERYEKILDFCAENKISSVTYFICGFKEDTLETTAGNLSYLADKQTLIGISPYYPVPGLPGFTDLSMFDKTPSAVCAGSSVYPWNSSLSTETMITAFRLSRFINLAKNQNRTEKENQLCDAIRSKRELYTVIKEKSGKERIIAVPKQDTKLVGLFFEKLTH